MNRSTYPVHFAEPTAGPASGTRGSAPAIVENSLKYSPKFQPGARPGILRPST